jgi:hypothetical protein
MPHVSRTTTPACRSTTSRRAPRTSAGSLTGPVHKWTRAAQIWVHRSSKRPGKRDIGSLPHSRPLAHVRPGSSLRSSPHTPPEPELHDVTLLVVISVLDGVKAKRLLGGQVTPPGTTALQPRHILTSSSCRPRRTHICHHRRADIRGRTRANMMPKRSACISMADSHWSCYPRATDRNTSTKCVFIVKNVGLD